MEDSLSEAAPPGIRFQAAKFLYEKHLEQLFSVRAPDRAQQLVEEETNLVQEACQCDLDEKVLRTI